jgi:hypothetical protein
MTGSKQGQRHRLLLYKQSVDRLWSPIFPVGLLLSGWTWFSGKYYPKIGFVPSTPPPYDLILYICIILIFGITLTCWVIRNMAYVQAKKDHIRVVTPFLAVKISYRRLIRSYPAQVAQLFTPGKVKKSVQSFVHDFGGETALVLVLKGYPLSKGVLRFFLGEAMIYPDGDSLVLLVPDWMGLSVEIESMQSQLQQKQSRYTVETNQSAGLLQSLRKK